MSAFGGGLNGSTQHRRQISLLVICPPKSFWTVRLATASNPLPAGGSYAEAPQQSVDKAYIHQLQAVAFRYSAMTNSDADLPKRGELCC
jgi:hypothetical protein